MKLQRQILKLYDWQSPNTPENKLDINVFAFIVRIYAEEGITLTDLFDELAESLDSSLESLTEAGFINTYVSLTINKFAT